MRRSEILVLLVLLAAAAAGCASECKQIRAEFEQLEISQKKAATSKMFKASAPEVLGVSVRAAVIEQMVSKLVLGEAKPTTKTLKLGSSKLVTQAELLDIELLPMGGCADCLRLSASVSLEAQVKAGRVTLLKTKGKGSTVARVPLVLEGSAKGSTLYADLGRASLEKASVDVADLPAAAREPLDRLVKSSVQRGLASMGRRIKLVHWDPVKIEGSKVRLVASKLLLFSEQQALWLGFKSNLLEPGAAIEPRVELQEGEDISAAFSGTLMSEVLRSMLASGTIRDRFNDDLKPDPKGDFRVRLASVKPTSEGLQTDFSVWRLPAEDDGCYVVQSKGVALAKPHPKKADKLKVKIRDIKVVETHGDDMLLDIGLWANSVFMTEALEAQTSVLSAKSMELGPLGKVDMKVARVAHDDASITVFSKIGMDEKR